MNIRKEQLDVVLDIDGFLADFEGYFCHTFGYKNRHMANLHDRYPDKTTEIENFVNTRSTYYMLAPDLAGVEIAKWLMQRVSAYGRRQNRAKVTILTSRPLRTFDVTKNWLKAEKIPYHKLEFSRTKVKWLEEHKPDIVVDDIIEVCEGAALKVPGITPVLFSHPWNETPFIARIHSLSAFQSIYQQVALEKLLDDFGGIGMAEDIPSP